jgi:hypothetical protein
MAEESFWENQAVFKKEHPFEEYEALWAQIQWRGHDQSTNSNLLKSLYFKGITPSLVPPMLLPSALVPSLLASYYYYTM